MSPLMRRSCDAVKQMVTDKGVELLVTSSSNSDDVLNMSVS